MPVSAKNRTHSLFVILLVITWVLFEIPTYAATGYWQMEFSNNELSVNIESTPLGVILEEIHKRAEIEFFHNKDQSDRVITVKFGFLPLERALARILRNLSYSILFGEEDKILRVTIIGRDEFSPGRYQEFFADDQLQVSEMNTESLPEVSTEDQVSAEDHEILIESTTTVSEMPDEPPSSGELESTSPSDAGMIVIDPPSGEAMEITHPSTIMIMAP